MERNKNSFISVKPDKSRLINLIGEIRDGEIKVPVFQREFVWKPQQMLELLDSILKGYPIGSLLFWKPESIFNTKEFIGPYKIDNTSKDLKYVLDGFQRLSTLFGTLSNPNDYKQQNELKEFQIYYNLLTKEFTYLRYQNNRNYYIPLYKIIDTFEFIDFLKDLEAKTIDKVEVSTLISNAKEVSKILYDYEIPFVEIKGGDIKSAVEIFSRINSTGTEISQDFMLSALSYNPETSFLFSDEITEFLTTLSMYNFEGLKRDTILNCISNSKGKIYFDIKVEDLVSSNLESLTQLAFPHIKSAVEFLHRRLLILDVRLLPYPTQLIFISEYFRINTKPTELDLDALEKWFWITTYSNYFTLYSLSQQRLAYEKFVEFSEGSHSSGILTISESFETAKFPEKLNFTGVRTKALQLFMLKCAYKDFQIDDGERISESFVFSNKDRTPGNMILRISSDFDKNNSKRKMVNDFIISESPERLKSFFINAIVEQSYFNKDDSGFIEEREFIIQEEEAKFVRSLGIKYTFGDRYNPF